LPRSTSLTTGMRAGLFAFVTALTLSACGSSGVSVSPPEPAGAAADACTAPDPALPGTVDGSAASETSPESPFTAAWGDLVLTCGGAGADVPPDAQVITIEDVTWYPEPLPQGGTRFTTIDRVATVALTVPATREPAAGAVAEISAAVARTVPAAEQPED
jgi:hypothetical protein